MQICVSNACYALIDDNFTNQSSMCHLSDPDNVSNCESEHQPSSPGWLLCFHFIWLLLENGNPSPSCQAYRQRKCCAGDILKKFYHNLFCTNGILATRNGSLYPWVIIFIVVAVMLVRRKRAEINSLFLQTRPIKTSLRPPNTLTHSHFFVNGQPPVMLLYVVM